MVRNVWNRDVVEKPLEIVGSLIKNKDFRVG
jgi:hypothetical protein